MFPTSFFRVISRLVFLTLITSCSGGESEGPKGDSTLSPLSELGETVMDENGKPLKFLTHGNSALACYYAGLRLPTIRELANEAVKRGAIVQECPGNPPPGFQLIEYRDSSGVTDRFCYDGRRYVNSDANFSGNYWSSSFSGVEPFALTAETGVISPADRRWNQNYVFRCANTTVRDQVIGNNPLIRADDYYRWIPRTQAVKYCSEKESRLPTIFELLEMFTLLGAKTKATAFNDVPVDDRVREEIRKNAEQSYMPIYGRNPMGATVVKIYFNADAILSGSEFTPGALNPGSVGSTLLSSTENVTAPGEFYSVSFNGQWGTLNSNRDDGGFARCIQPAGIPKRYYPYVFGEYRRPEFPDRPIDGVCGENVKVGEPCYSNRKAAVAFCSWGSRHLLTAREYAKYSMRRGAAGILEVDEYNRKLSAGQNVSDYLRIEVVNSDGKEDSFYFSARAILPLEERGVGPSGTDMVRFTSSTFKSNSTIPVFYDGKTGSFLDRYESGKLGDKSPVFCGQ